MKQIEQINHSFSTSQEQDDTASALEAFNNVHDALMHDDPMAALESLEHLTTEDIIWRLSSENEILQTFEPKLPEKVKSDIQDAILTDAITLATHRLPAEELSGLGLETKYYDDAGIGQPPTIRDAFLIAQSWDNTDHNETIGGLLAVMLDNLPENMADTPKQALQHALEDGVDFSDAYQEIAARIDSRLDRQPVNVSKTSEQEKPLEGPSLDQYEWLWYASKKKPGED